jgi:hypothetical protein
VWAPAAIANLRSPGLTTAGNSMQQTGSSSARGWRTPGIEIDVNLGSPGGRLAGLHHLTGENYGERDKSIGR